MKSCVCAIAVLMILPALNAFAGANPQCKADATSSWSSCITYQTNGATPSLGEVVIDNTYLPDGRIIGADLGKVQFSSVNGYIVLVNGQVILKFNDGSPDFIIGTVKGQQYSDAYGFSSSQEMVLASGVSAVTSQQVTPMQPYYDINEPTQLCEEVKTNMVQTVTILTNGARTYTFSERPNQVMVSNTPVSMDKCKNTSAGSN